MNNPIGKLFAQVVDDDDDDAILSTAEIEGSGLAQDEYITLGGDDDDEWRNEDGEYYEIPLWPVMIMIVCLAVCCVGVAFYCSYKHERTVKTQRISNRSTNSPLSKENPDKTVQQLEEGDLRVSIKKWHRHDEGPARERAGSAETQSIRTAASTDSSDVSTDGEDSLPSCSDHKSLPSSEDSTTPSEDSSRKSTLRKSLAQLVTTPRCVLCSKSFEAGEDVAHSENPTKCHHEYHQACLANYWNKNAQNHGNCPVCKEQFLLQMTA